MRPPLSSTLFPYTTLFRSLLAPRALSGRRAVLGVKASPKVRERVDRSVVGEVEVERRDRDVALVQRAHVRALELLRSEEHTSELQSRLHLVCRLLLEKKNT